LVVEMQNDKDTFGRQSVDFFRNYTFTMWFSKFFWLFTNMGENLYPYKNLNRDVYCNVINNLKWPSLGEQINKL
jgi:hypothetical protein